DVGTDLADWCDAATDDLAESRVVERRIHAIRERVNSFNLPYLSLPIGTPRHTALQVFIKMNTSYVRLSPFDIVVAQVEEKSGTSLTELRDDHLRADVPDADAYSDLDDLILSVAALRQ